MKVAEWMKAEEARKIRNEKRDDELKEAKEAWKREKEEVKVRGEVKIKDWKVTNPEPKKSDPQFKHEPAITKPKLRSMVPVDDGEESGEEFDLNVSSDDDE